ncbi:MULTISPECIES: L,D-transpeptidase family protein [Microbacterium]|uniref:L,D-transpeptidase family protein n=1 Tax=Microbacterium marmarense TaxID=3122051 RepID=A0ABU8LVB1_9MICO
MTDLATKPGSDETSPGENSDAPASEDTPVYEWAPAEPKKKRRAGLWIGVGAAAAAVSLVATSLVLIAPGTAVAGVPVGFLTVGAAADAIQQQLSDTTVILTGEGADAVVTGADLGASVDARALADQAYAENPLWNVTAWFSESADATIVVDEAAASSTLRAALPGLYADPTNATIAYDADSKAYVATPAVDGTGVGPAAVVAALEEAFLAGEESAEIEISAAPVSAETTTEVAEATAESLNAVLSRAGFYIGDERVVPFSRADTAELLTVAPVPGGFDISANAEAIQAIVDTLPEQINRDAVNAVVITDSGGGVLREITAGVSGRELGDTSGIAAAFAAQLAAGEAVYELPVETTDFTTAATERRIEVDLGAQTTYLFENDSVVNSWPISSGLPGETVTHTGSYRIFAHVPIQDMGCFDGAEYCTEDVPWVMYFNGDQGFHGTYWHNNFGTPMSHGCVNMPVDVAKYVYDWAPTGTEVWVHA